MVLADQSVAVLPGEGVHFLDGGSFVGVGADVHDLHGGAFVERFEAQFGKGHGKGQVP